MDSLFWGNHTAIQTIRRQLELIDQRKINILIQGESGTGKTALAHFIRSTYHRSDDSVVILDDFDECPMELIPPHRKIIATVTSMEMLNPSILFRIGEFSIRLPPLRERTNELFPLLDFLMKKFSVTRPFTDWELKWIENHDWPGNIREMENCVMTIQATDKSWIVKPKDDETLESIFERIYIAAALRFHPTKKEARMALGLGKKAFYEKLKKLAIQQDP